VIRDALHYLVAITCGIGTRLVFDLHVEGPRRYRQLASTLVVVNHKRDSDSVTVPPLLIFNGVRPIRPMWFAGREDMFVTGFLGLQPPIPGLLRPALGRTNLSRVLDALHILPMRRFPERTLHEALDEFVRVIGDRPVAQVLNAAEVEMPAVPGWREASVSDVLAWRHRSWWLRKASLRTFLPAWQNQLAALQREVVDRQLRAMAAVLDRGDTLYLAAEGVLSADGRLQQFRAGLRRVLTLARSPVRCLPVGIVYDFMRPGRMRVFIAMGEEMPAVGRPAEIERQTRAAVAALNTMTATQIGSTILWDRVAGGGETIGRVQLASAMFELAAALRDDGVRVDQVLLGTGRTACVDGYVAYLKRRGIVLADRAELLVDAPHVLRVPAVDRQNPVRYAVNELESVLATLRKAGPGTRDRNFVTRSDQAGPRSPVPGPGWVWGMPIT
jgi:hypothetical protein